MNPALRFVQRLLILGLGALTVWFVVFVVFEAADRRMPLVLSVVATYGIAAYIIFPRVVRLGYKLLKRQHVPRYTVTGDGLPGDPVNLVLIGTKAQLSQAFAAAGWFGADPISLKSSWRMTWTFIRNTPYPTAPFSTLYLFGRGQDIGFQKAIDNSPRKRHHIRFWALSPHFDQSAVQTAAFWLNADRPPDGDRVLWVGAGTRDTGLGLTRLTYKITHATDSDTNAERDFVLSELKKPGGIGEVRIYQAGDAVDSGTVNHYITDGELPVATLA
jgi:hypothetical protein